MIEGAIEDLRTSASYLMDEVQVLKEGGGPRMTGEEHIVAMVAEEGGALEGVLGHNLTEIIFSVSILFVCLIALVMEMWIILKSAKGWGGDNIKVVGLTLVVFAGLFLITAGYSQAQIAGIVGLLGVIVGHLLGVKDKKSDGG